MTAEPRIRFYAGAPIRSPEGKPLGTLCVIDTVPRSMTAADRSRLQTLAAGVSSLLHLHRTATDLQRAATHDTLTGLANRTLFDHRLEKAVADARLGRPCAMLLLDLDGFKRINDRLGHMAGDEMLQEVAQRLRKVARGTDLVARLGGDEFAILLCDPADEAAAQALCGRILTEFRAPMTLEGRSVVAQTSIGVAHCPMDAQEPGTLLRAADHALYQAKRAGRGRAVRAGERRLSLPMLSDGQELEADLRRALQADALEIAWQPFIRTATGEIAGFEALTRWTRPGHGPVEPAILIPFAEAAGLIVALESRILQLACAQAALWPKQADVSVNLSARWFAAEDGEATALVGLVRETLRASGLPPRRICLEITERTLVGARHAARPQLEAVRALGVRVALDDFGTGFSSLGYLRDMPFDIIKLGGSFVAALGTDTRATKVAQAIIALGHGLDMEVCAEGVETKAQFEQLRAEGCDMAQGYWVGAPVSVPKFGMSPRRTGRPKLSIV